MRPLTLEDILGFTYAVGFTVCLGLLVAGSRMPAALKRLVYAALALRVFGAVARYYVFWEVYLGSGDATGYYRRGVEFSARIWRGDFSPFYDPRLWFAGRWTGSGFVAFPSTFVIGLIGPSMIGEYVIFSLFAFLGLVGFAVAFKRTHPEIPLQRYARWIFLFPSLWYWPAGVGKEALIMMGVGLAFWGFIGKHDRIQWPLLVLGAFLVWAIRPQVAAIVILSMVLAYWLSFGRRWTLGKVAQGFAILIVGVVGLGLAMRSMGLQDFGVEGVQEYVEATQAAQDERGSTVGQVGLGVTSIPMAMVNILTRPWPWEARSATTLLSALEMMLFWGIVWYRRKNLMRALRTWRSDPLLRVAVPFVVIYSVSLGILVINLGIIARQRVFIFPFLFLLLEAAPSLRRGRATRGHARAGPGAAPDLIAERAQ